MNNFFEQLKNIREKTTLSRPRKEEIKRVILRFAEEHPTPEEALRNPRRMLLARSFQFRFLPVSTLVAVALFALLGGGTSLAAESALPGDFLYPVKIALNEGVRGALSFSPEAKAKWDSRRAERRLEEAAGLILREGTGGSAVAYEKIEENFSASADRAEERIEMLNQRGKARAAADVISGFEASLGAHEKILERLNEKKGYEKGMGPVVEKVEERLDGIRERRVAIEEGIVAHDGKPETRKAAEEKIKAAERLIAKTRSYLDNEKENLDEEALSDAKTKLAIAEGTVADAGVKIEAGLYGEAFNVANRAMRIAQEARALAESELKSSAVSAPRTVREKEKINQGERPE